MPSCCCVPGCNSNYSNRKSSVPTVSVFKFPTDSKKCGKWLRSIHRPNFVPTKHSVVCIKHFDDRHIVREDSATRPDGTVLTVKRDKLKLTPDAFPSKFVNRPSYMTIKLPPIRKDPSARRQEIKKREDERKQVSKVVIPS